MMENNSDAAELWSCGICLDAKVAEKDFFKHQCMSKYKACSVVTESKTKKFYPKNRFKLIYYTVVIDGVKQIKYFYHKSILEPAATNNYETEEHTNFNDGRIKTLNNDWTCSVCLEEKVAETQIKTHTCLAKYKAVGCVKHSISRMFYPKNKDNLVFYTDGKKNLQSMEFTSNQNFFDYIKKIQADLSSDDENVSDAESESEEKENLKSDPDDLWTCGICLGAPIAPKNILSHSCMSKYEAVGIVKNSSLKTFYPKNKNNYFYRTSDADGVKKVVSHYHHPLEPTNSDNQNILQIHVDSENNNSVGTKKRNADHQLSLSSPKKIKKRFSHEDECGDSVARDKFLQFKTTRNRVDFNEKLIRLVHENEILWNIKLKPSEKRTEDIPATWDYVADSMGGYYTGENIKSLWKNLVDTYKKAINDNKKKTGQAAKKKKVWPHMESMDFIKDVQLEFKNTYCNITNYDDDDDDGGGGGHDKCEETEVSIGQGKSNRKSKSKEEAIDKLTSAIEGSTPVINMPAFPAMEPVPPPDKVDAFLHHQAHRLRKLSGSDLEETMDEIIDLIKNKTVEYKKKRNF